MPSQTYDTPGTYQFELAGKENITFQVWGAGGSGGYPQHDAQSGGGGGGGAYAEGAYTATQEEETELILTVGQGGQGQNGQSDAGGYSGIEAVVGVGCIVGGGTAGENAAGTGGTLVQDDYSWTTSSREGGDGYWDNDWLSGGGGGSSAGTALDGVDAGDELGAIAPEGGGNGGNGGAEGGTGVNGSSPGGGGGGAGASNNLELEPGNGGNGKIIMTWDTVAASYPLAKTNLVRDITPVVVRDPLVKTTTTGLIKS